MESKQIHKVIIIDKKKWFKSSIKTNKKREIFKRNLNRWKHKTNKEDDEKENILLLKNAYFNKKK